MTERMSTVALPEAKVAKPAQIERTELLRSIECLMIDSQRLQTRMAAISSELAGLNAELARLGLAQPAWTAARR